MAASTGTRREPPRPAAAIANSRINRGGSGSGSTGSRVIRSRKFPWFARLHVDGEPFGRVIGDIVARAWALASAEHQFRILLLPNALFVEPQVSPGDNPVPDIAGDVLQNPGLLPQPLRNWHRHRVNAELTIWSKHPSALHPHGLHVVEVGLIRRPRRHLAVVDNRVPVTTQPTTT